MVIGELPRRNPLTIIELQRCFDDVGAGGDITGLTRDLAARLGLTANIQPSHPLGATPTSSDDRNAEPGPEDPSVANCQSGATHHESLGPTATRIKPDRAVLWISSGLTQGLSSSSSLPRVSGTAKASAAAVNGAITSNAKANE